MGRHARAVGSAMTIRVGGLRPRRRGAPLGRRAERIHRAAPRPRARTRSSTRPSPQTSATAAVTGALDYDTWAARVAERLGSPEAVAEWGEFRGHLDPEAVELVDAVRAGGCRVGLLSNATTRLEEDLAFLGLDDTFDVVFNTARLGRLQARPRGLPPRRRRARRAGRPDRLHRRHPQLGRGGHRRRAPRHPVHRRHPPPRRAPPAGRSLLTAGPGCARAGPAFEMASLPGSTGSRSIHLPSWGTSHAARASRSGPGSVWCGTAATSGRRKPSATARASSSCTGAQKLPTSSRPTGLAWMPELGPRHRLERLLQGADPAGEHHEPVGQVGHQRLALVHRLDHPQVGDPLVHDLPAVQEPGDHTDHLAAARPGPRRR